MLTVWLINSVAYSQTLILSEKGDTNVCFTIPQSKYLLKQVYKAKEYVTLDSICEAQLVLCDTVNKRNERIIYDYKMIDNNYNKMLGLKQHEIDRLTQALNEEKKKTRRQKLYKWIAIGTTGLVTGAFGYYIVTH